jgi:hypothetical protein
MSELTPQHVLTDLFGSGDFPAEIIDPEHAAEIVIQRLIDAGFEIVPADRGSAAQAMPEETQPCQLTQLLRR